MTPGEEYDEAIRELKDENSRLLKLVAEKNFEIKSLSKKLESEKSVNQHIGNGDAASTKIIELSKKLREQNSDLEIERSKVKQLQKKCFDLEKQVFSGKNNLTADDFNKSEQDAKSGDLKATQDRLKQAEAKANEYRNQAQSLKAEIKLLQKVLCQEVGENVSIQMLLTNPGNWKGRSQQIAILQKKIVDLKKQISDFGIGQNDHGIEESDSSHSNVSLSGSKEVTKIRQIEKTKKENLEKVMQDLKILEEELISQKQKCEALKARNQTILNENKALKQQAKILLEKEKHDNELIEALMKKQTLLKGALLEESKQKISNTPSTTNSGSNHRLDVSEVTSLKKLLLEKEEKIKSLEDKLIQFKLTLTDGPQHSEKSIACDDSLDVKEVEQQGDHQTQCVLETLYSEAMAERDALIKQVETLEKRSQNLSMQLIETQGELQTQTKLAATLEKKLGKIKSDQGNPKPNLAGASDIQQELEKTLQRLEIQKDENNALKKGLQSTLKSKEEDLRIYINMLENARKIFMDGTKKLRNK